jgi:hypothetical protein
MNNYYRQREPDLKQAERFDLEPAPPWRGARESELETLKARLLRERLERTEQLNATAELRRAANEAAAMAWLTAYPLLVFPSLFDEKARQARRQLNKQAVVRGRSKAMTSFAE